MLETANMTDKELDEAITYHFKKLDDLEITDNNDNMAKLLTPESNISNDIYYPECTGDWNGNHRNLLDTYSNGTSGNSEWKSKTLYSMSNPSHHAKCNVLYSKTYSNGVAQNGTFHLNEQLDEENLSFLCKIRRCLADYQEKQGIPKIDYPFSALIKLIGQMTAKSLLVLFYIIVNIAPMAQIILFIIRFVLDKMIIMQQTKGRHQRALKIMFLTCQLLCIHICLIFTVGLIWMPILNIVLQIISCCTIYSSSDRPTELY